MAARRKQKKDVIAQLKELNRNLKEGNISRIYLLYGDEPYLIEQSAQSIKAAVIPEGDTMNYSHFDSDGADEKAIMALADTMPFFAERRLIMIDDSGYFSSSHEELAKYISNIPQTTCIVFTEKKADSRTKMFKAVSSNGMCVELSLPDQRYLVSWLAGIMKREGRQAQKGVLEYLTSVTAQDMYSMKNELIKVMDYAGERAVITADDVDAVCCVSAENRVFDMIDAVAKGDRSGALRMYDDLVTLREPPLRILFNMCRQFSRLYEIKELVQKGYGSRDIAEKTGIREFIVRKSLPMCSRFSMTRLREAVEDAAQLDEDFKTGRLAKDSLAVEMMIIKYSGNCA